MAVNRYPITIIGCGPGSEEYVTPAARSAVCVADVLIGAQRLLDLFPECEAGRIAVKADIKGLLDEIELLSKEKRIAVLVTGDPGLLSLAKPVIARFGRGACRVIAGVSSLQVAFAALGLDWHDVLVVDAHEGPPSVEDGVLAGARKIAIFTGKKESLPWISSLTERFSEAYRAFVCRDLTLSGEVVREIRMEDFAGGEYSSLSMVILVKKELLS